MIDINELRRLAQAATPGPWVSQGRYIGTPRHMSYIGEVRDQCGNWSDTEKSRADSAFIAAANPATIYELLDRLEEAESDALEQARLNGMGASREAALMAKLEVSERDIALKERIIDALGSTLNAAANERDALRTEYADLRSGMTFRTSLIGRIEAERDALQAKVEAMERQEPVAWLHETRRDSDVVTTAVKHVWGKVAVGSMAAYSIPLYLAPGAQGE